MTLSHCYICAAHRRLGPFANWRIIVREKDQGGPLDWGGVKEAFLELEGCGMPF